MYRFRFARSSAFSKVTQSLASDKLKIVQKFLPRKLFKPVTVVTEYKTHNGFFKNTNDSKMLCTVHGFEFI